jgi:hypothetical protein
MKASLLILITFLFTSCMDITIPDFKSDKQPEDEKGEEAGSNTDNGSSDEEEGDGPSETVIDNTYPLITSATIQSEALPYISLFIFYGNIFGQNLDYSNLIVSFENNVNGAYVGQCSSINGNQNKLIKINNDIWQGLNNTYREQLIFHEAAHCVLGRPHKGNNFLSPESILNPSLFPDYIYIQRYNEFIYELFESPITEHDFVFGEMRSRE